MKKRNVLNSPRLSALKKKRRRDLLNKVLIYFVIFLIFFVGLIFISRIDKLNVNTIIITGNKVVDTEAINKIVEENIFGYYLYFIPKSNFLLVPKNKIKNDLTNQYKRLQNISFNTENPNVLAISLSEREGKYIWCGESMPDFSLEAEEKPCYFTDQEGYIFDLAPYFSGDVYFKFFGPLGLNEGESPLGLYFSKDIFTKLVSFKNILVDFDLKPNSVLVKNNGDIEIYLSSSNKTNPPRIVLKSDFDLDKSSENLQAALATEPLKSDIKNKYSSLLYIDLRLGNKVYFKFQ
ncbi:hypothetical protein COU49_02820 [Candidatus Nomurabacteria bacterium CG10_big_fil_rev_8_21_14_0_10_35_16]|uniref:POTRA domain-containing protein n=1 Tax=Candidatus Nomurabacteria bacterium CG10_big_fil_rev_8_21_14_0_10_35_16 TaxID=1974731 RepID=A0A2H0TAN7_9BACT|nr:MAG: hypothetical protein COU49_02820 [Candidatus Nomurabacteria bacterium CG10_big_fil_rev_8_21_14_0_10_35_16]